MKKQLWAVISIMALTAGGIVSILLDTSKKSQVKVNADTTVNAEWQGWSASTADSYTATSSLESDSLVYDITAVPASLTNSYDAKIGKYSLSYPAGSYEATFTLSSSVEVTTASIVVATASPWNSYNSLYNETITTKASEHKVLFTLDSDHSDVEFDIELGKCGVAKITLSKVEVKTLTKSLLEESSFDSTTYSSRIDSGAAATIVSGEGYVEMEVTTFPTAGNNWALGFAKNTIIGIVSGNYYSIDIGFDCTYSQYYEFMVQPNTWGPDTARTGYSSGTLSAGVSSKNFSFRADKDVANAYIELYIGTDGRETGETSNQIVKITSLKAKTLETKNAYTFSLTASDLAGYVLDQDKDGQCATRYSEAKTFYEAIPQAEQDLFITTSSDALISKAATRYAAWAINQNANGGAQSAAFLSDNEYLIPTFATICFFGAAIGLSALVIYKKSAHAK